MYVTTTAITKSTTTNVRRNGLLTSNGAKNLCTIDSLLTSNGAKTLCTLDSLLMFGSGFGGVWRWVGSVWGVFGSGWEVLRNW